MKQEVQRKGTTPPECGIEKAISGFVCLFYPLGVLNISIRLF
jgi:hypothetical protein